jgi:hypothetical protein
MGYQASPQRGGRARSRTQSLSGWERERKVVVLRRRLKGDLLLANRPQPGQLELAFVETLETVGPYEYSVLVTDLAGEILTLAQYYRNQADCENIFDELKNQWGWSGFTSQDQKRCQINHGIQIQ